MEGVNFVRNTALLVAMLAMFSTGVAMAKKPAPVRVEQGLLQGTLVDGVMVYKGVPYAAPPVGNLRWRAPQPPAHWNGIRKADKSAANPMQVMYPKYGPWTSAYMPKGKISEDCLYLNIWTSAKSPGEKLPVLVFIPGGAFTGGSGDVPLYNGKNLAKKGVVVVTINYRVGVFGFLALPALTKESKHHSSGNYGLLDQLAALKWVHENISAFGGNPNRVTIMGQSAGALSVMYLTASPLAKGLFIRAIAESPTDFRNGLQEKLKTAEEYGEKFERAMGVPSLAQLRAIPATKLLEATSSAYHFLPIVDGWYLRGKVDDIFKTGRQNDVVTIAGRVANERSFMDDYGNIPAKEFQERVRRQTGALADEILKLYPASTTAEAGASQKKFLRDISMVSMYIWAKDRERTGKTDLYMYLFRHPQPGATQKRYETFHSAELPYVFDNLNESHRPWTAEDRKLEKEMSAYWVNFITTGNPNGKGLPKWLSFRETGGEAMELGDKMEPRPITSREKFEVLKKLLEVSKYEQSEWSIGN